MSSGAIIKNAIVVAAALSLVASFTSCENKGKKAETLYKEAVASYESEDYDEALKQIHLLDSIYGTEVEVRRKAMHLKPQIVEKQLLKSLSDIDSLAAVTRWKVDSLSSQMCRKGNAIEPYFVHASDPSDINSVPGLYMRMAPDAMLYLVAVSNKKIDGFFLVSSDGKYRSKVLPHDGERCQFIGSGSVLTFLEGEIAELPEYLISHRGNEIMLVGELSGREQVRMTLTAKKTEVLASVSELALETRKLKKLELDRAKTERLLDLSRNQIARTTLEEPSTK